MAAYFDVSNYFLYHMSEHILNFLTISLQKTSGAFEKLKAMIKKITYLLNYFEKKNYETLLKMFS